MIDWRAPFAESFYQATFDDRRGLDRRVSYVGHIDDLLIEDFAAGDRVGVLAAHGRAVPQSRRRDAGGGGHPAVRPGPAGPPRPGGPPRAAGRAGHRQDGRGAAPGGVARLQRPPHHRRPHPGRRARATASCGSWPRCCRRWARPASPRPPSSGCSGPASAAGGDERWLGLLDRLEDQLFQPDEVQVGHRRVTRRRGRRADGPAAPRDLPWRDRRRIFVETLAGRLDRPAAEVSQAAVHGVAPRRPPRRSCAGCATVGSSSSSGPTPTWWTSGWHGGEDGALTDEVRSRFEGVPRPVRPRDRRRGAGPDAAAAAGGAAPGRRPDAGRRRRPAPRPSRHRAAAGGRAARRRPRADGHRLPHVGRDRRLAQRGGPRATTSTPSRSSASDRPASRSRTSTDVDRARARARASAGPTSRPSPPTTCGPTRASSTTAWWSTRRT